MSATNTFRVLVCLHSIRKITHCNFSFVLFCCETWFTMLTEEYRPMIFEKKVLRRNFLKEDLLRVRKK